MRIRNVTHAGKAVIRRCAGCGAMKDRRDMIRIIRSQDGKVLVDETRKRNGRGAYLCFSVSCLETAIKRHSLERTLKCSVGQDVYTLLREKTEALQ